PTKPGDYMIVDGERRWRNSGELKIERLPVKVRQMTDAQAHEYQLISGTQRANLTALEEADAIWDQYTVERMKGNSSYEKFAENLGIARSTAYNRRTLATMPAVLRDAMKSGKMDADVALQLATVKEPQKLKVYVKNI